MFFIVRLSWKNLWRNPRRTLITANAIAFGVMALVYLHNYYDAFHAQLVENAIRYHSGHLLIGNPEFHEHKSPGRFLRHSKKIERWIAGRGEVKAFSPYVLLQGLLSSPQGSVNIWFKGVDPSHEKQVTKFASNLTKGAFLGKARGKPIVLGSGVAELLKVKVGSKVVALTQGVDGSIGNELFIVNGIFETRSEMDKGLAFILIPHARQLLSLPADTSHLIAVLLKHEKDISQVKQIFHAENERSGAQMLSWDEVQRHLMALIELNKSANRLLMGIILCIAGMGIVNSILMSIMERRREFGVMMAVGTTHQEMVQMVLMETLLLSVVGVAIGNILGLGLTLYFGKYGFDLRWLTDQTLVVNGNVIQTVSYPVIHWLNNVVISTVILGIALTMALIPMRSVSKLTAVKALASR